jgi:PTS system ascorbate-specific IIC component
MNLTNWMFKGLVGEPTILLGLIACVGLLLLKAPLYRVLNGAVKTMIGFVLLQLGAQAAGTSLSNLSAIVQESFQIIGVIPYNETIYAMAQINYSREIAFVIVIAMPLHLLIARFTPIKYVFLSGHHMLFMAALLSAVLVPFSMSIWITCLFGGMILAVMMSLGPAIAQPYVRRVMGNNQVAIAHFNSIGYLFSGWVADLFPSRKGAPEPKRLQKAQPYIQDHMVVITVFMFILFAVSSVFAVNKNLDEMFSGQHFLIISLIQSLWFASGVYIILAGVRMLLAEIVPAFQGIAERLVPGAIPAVDSPILFTYSPLSAVAGFLLSFIGGIVAMICMYLSGTTVIIPGVVPHFFSGGAAGVIAYKIGGHRGMVIASLVHGFVLTLLPALLIPVLPGLGFIRTTFADTDYTVVGVIVHRILSWLLGA